MLRQIQPVAVLIAGTFMAGCCCGPVPLTHYGAPAVGAHLAAILNSPLFCVHCGHHPCHAMPPCCPAGYCSPVPSYPMSPYLGGMPGDLQAGCGEAWYPGSITPYASGAYGSLDNASGAGEEGTQQPVPGPVPSPVPAETPVPDPIVLPEAFDDASAFDTRGVRRTGLAGTANLSGAPARPVGSPGQVSGRELRPAVSLPQVISQPPLLVVPAESH